MSHTITRTLTGSLRVTCFIPAERHELARTFQQALDHYTWVIHPGETLPAEAWISRIIIGYDADPRIPAIRACITEAMQADEHDPDVIEF